MKTQQIMRPFPPEKRASIGFLFYPYIMGKLLSGLETAARKLKKDDIADVIGKFREANEQLKDCLEKKTEECRKMKMEYFL
jgi:hypothetical protein